MRVIIVGGGRTLYFLCRNVISRGSEVTIINRNPEECRELAGKLKARVICGDATEPAILEDAGAMGADTVIALTPYDHDNMVICQIASLAYDVPRTVSLANDPDNVSVFESMGIASFSTTHIVSSLIEQRTFFEQAINLLPIGEGKVNITEIPIKDCYPVSGKKLSEIKLPLNGLIAVIIRGERAIIPRGEDRIQDGDKVVAVSTPESYGQMLRALTGEN